MALAWKAGWEKSLRGSNPLSSANYVPRTRVVRLHCLLGTRVRREGPVRRRLGADRRGDRRDQRRDRDYGEAQRVPMLTDDRREHGCRDDGREVLDGVLHTERTARP